jgi:hypothetical protein
MTESTAPRLDARRPGRWSKWQSWITRSKDNFAFGSNACVSHSATVSIVPNNTLALFLLSYYYQLPYRPREFAQDAVILFFAHGLSKQPRLYRQPNPLGISVAFLAQNISDLCIYHFDYTKALSSASISAMRAEN